MNFYEWLVTQNQEDTPIGDLARDVMSDKDERCPRQSSKFSEWKNYFRFRMACDDARIALRDAFVEYRKQ